MAYFTNQYPAVSHTFIRREIRAMEALGVTVTRFALRCSENLVDPEDQVERNKTRYLLSASAGEFVVGLLTWLFRQPLGILNLLRLALAVGWRSDRGMLRHFAYAAEALLLAEWCRRDAIEHIHAHFGTNPAVIAMLAGRLAGIIHSFTAHGSEEFEKAPLLSLDKKLHHSAFAVCVSSFWPEPTHALVTPRSMAKDLHGALWPGQPLS